MIPLKSHTFRGRLFNSIFILFVLFILCFLAFQYQREKLYKQEILNNVLIEYANLVDIQIQKEGLNPTNIATFIQNIPRNDLRITLLDKEGKVLFDSEKEKNSETIYDNHLSRPEIKQALRKGNGFNTRHSITHNKIYFYSAYTYNDYIIRCSIPYNGQLSNKMQIDKNFVYFTLIMLCVIAAILFNYSRRLSKSIQKLRFFAMQAGRNKLSDIEQLSFPSDELGEISQHIIQLYNRLAHTKDALYIEKEKLFMHLQFSKEGLSIYTSDMKEILANNLFIQYINLISDRRVKASTDIFQIKELQPISNFITQYILNGKQPIQGTMHESLKLTKNGKTFLVDCLIFPDKSFEISINDITQEEEESTLKRQLTQNISHELKTPVSSILGYIETILNNPLLPEEKRNLFTQRCYAQTLRLSHLLSDISLLNRMDEAQNLFENEPINLMNIIQDVEKDVNLSLNEQQMTFDTYKLPESIMLRGNYALLYSIFRNLTDNAIAYAGKGTHIYIKCYREDKERYYFSFADNGVGIQEEHLTRIFERFYRVDKGRTRKMGGTGLGLSIVKNAILIHKGTISAKIRQGGGLEFIFSLAK